MSMSYVPNPNHSDMSWVNKIIDGVNRHQRLFASLANAAGQTLTAAQVVNAILSRSGAAAVSDTLPTAAQMVANLVGCQVGSTFEFTVLNGNSGTLTVLTGAGVTLTGNATVAAGSVRRFIGVVNNATAGSEAVTVQNVGTWTL